MNKLETLIQRYENQIEKAFDTLVEIEGINEVPRHLDTWTEIAVWIMFASILSRNLWDKLSDKQLTEEQRIELFVEIANTTREHYKELYWYDNLELTKKLDKYK